jgi:hypothetical protein
MGNVRYLKLERSQENALMQLPIDSPFIARFTVQPFFYKRTEKFIGLVERRHVPHVCTIDNGYLHGEEIMRDRRTTTTQRTFVVPITSARQECNSDMHIQCVRSIVVGYDRYIA